MMTPEQFYSESKWPEMKDKFDKSALLFHYYDLCQFANDYAQHYRNVIKLTTADKERIENYAKEYSDEFTDTGLFKYNNEVKYDAFMAGYDYAQQEIQAYRDMIKELLPFAIKAKYSTSIHNEKGREDVRKILSTIERARKLIDTVTPTSNPEQS